MSNPFKSVTHELDQFLDASLSDEIKKQYTAHINAAREEFCGKLMMCGLGPDKVTVEEQIKPTKDGGITFSIVAKYIESGELVELDEVYGKQESPEESLGIWEDAAFLSWFNTQTANVQEVIKKYPPDQTYKIPGYQDPAQLYSFKEAVDGSVSLTVVIHNPETGPQYVDDVNPSDLTPFRSKGDS